MPGCPCIKPATQRVITGFTNVLPAPSSETVFDDLQPLNDSAAANETATTSDVAKVPFLMRLPYRVLIPDRVNWRLQFNEKMMNSAPSPPEQHHPHAATPTEKEPNHHERFSFRKENRHPCHRRSRAGRAYRTEKEARRCRSHNRSYLPQKRRNQSLEIQGMGRQNQGR